MGPWRRRQRTAVAKIAVVDRAGDVRKTGATAYTRRLALLAILARAAA